MEKYKRQIFYGISIDGKKPCIWDEQMPDLEKTNLNFSLLYNSCEIIEKNVTYKSVKKIL